MALSTVSGRLTMVILSCSACIRLRPFHPAEAVKRCDKHPSASCRDPRACSAASRTASARSGPERSRLRSYRWDTGSSRRVSRVYPTRPVRTSRPKPVLGAERGLGGARRPVDVVVRMRHRNEGGFELRRRPVDAAVEQAAVKMGEALGVRLQGVLERSNRAGVEEERDHGADALDHARYPGLLERRRQAAFEPRAERLESRVGSGIERRECRQPRGDRQRISAESACLVDRTERSDGLQDVTAATIGGERHPATDHLTEARERRLEAVAFLGAASSRGGFRS